MAQSSGGQHLIFSWLKGDWTTILHIRNEIRNKDKTVNGWKESSGSTIFYFSPQINYTIREKWNISVLADLPVYQYFNGTQLATKYSISLNFARDFKLFHIFELTKNSSRRVFVFDDIFFHEK